MLSIRSILGAFALTGLVACGPSQADLAEFGHPDVSRLSQTAPPGVAPGTCWGKTVTPAIIETVTNQVLVQPTQTLPDGTVTKPAVYNTETRQDIVRARQDVWFETPCEGLQTPEFIASIQRALKARGAYRGQITGTMDTRTRNAVRRFQKKNDGLDSGILSLQTARALGLVAVERDPS